MTLPGGKVLLCADMGQVLHPVMDRIPPSGEVHLSLSAWEHWQSCRKLSLTEIMRAISDSAFTSYLMAVRDGSGNLGLTTSSCQTTPKHREVEMSLISKLVELVRRFAR